MLNWDFQSCFDEDVVLTVPNATHRRPSRTGFVGQTKPVGNLLLLFISVSASTEAVASDPWGRVVFGCLCPGERG